MSHVTVKSIPVLEDNYIHVIIVSTNGESSDESNSKQQAIVVDPAEAQPVIDFLSRNKLELTGILITHHHNDHTGGVAGLLKLNPDISIFGYTKDSHRLPKLTDAVDDNETVNLAGLVFDVWHLPGHTSGHIAYINQQHKITFSGDVLFGMGCGRVFEGTYPEMYTSLQRLKSLPPETKIYCTHEYTVTNGQFALHAMPGNDPIASQLDAARAARANGQFTVPLLLADELECNPFLLAKSIDEFSQLRDARNQWRGIPNSI